MADWPTSCPGDLRHNLEAVLDQRNRPLAADVWTELRDWLIANGVQVPEGTKLDESWPFSGGAILDQ